MILHLFKKKKNTRHVIYDEHDLLQNQPQINNIYIYIYIIILNIYCYTFDYLFVSFYNEMFIIDTVVFLFSNLYPHTIYDISEDMHHV